MSDRTPENKPIPVTAGKKYIVQPILVNNVLKYQVHYHLYSTEDGIVSFALHSPSASQSTFSAAQAQADALNT